MERREIGSTTKITDLNFDCLASCFQYLSIEGLLNVADSNKQLRDVAKYLLARVSSTVCVKKEISRRDVKFEWYKSRNGRKWLELSDLKLCLQFLRCSGDLVPELKIDFYENIPNAINSALIVNYINEYCAESLTKIKFFDCLEGALNGLTKPFKNVVKIKMTNVHPPANKFNELFPNLREFKLSCNHICVPDEFFTNHYPSLEDLTVLSTFRNKRFYENVAILLLNNPQVKSFHGNIGLQVIFDTKRFSDAKGQLQNVEKLDLFLSSYQQIAFDERINLENLKELRLFRFNSCDFPFRSDKLESLTIQTNCNSVRNEENIRKFIAKCPNVKKLQFRFFKINHFEIANTLPLLEEIDFSGYKVYFTVDEVVRFVRQFHSLKLFRLCSRTDISMKRLAARLGSAWLVSFETSHYNFSFLNDQFKSIIKLKR